MVISNIIKRLSRTTDEKEGCRVARFLWGGSPETLRSPWVGGEGGGGIWGGEVLMSPPQWADSWGESTRGHSPLSVPSYLSARTLGVGTKVGEVGAGVVVRGAGCEERVR